MRWDLVGIGFLFMTVGAISVRFQRDWFRRPLDCFGIICILSMGLLCFGVATFSAFAR